MVGASARDKPRGSNKGSPEKDTAFFSPQKYEQLRNKAGLTPKDEGAGRAESVARARASLRREEILRSEKTRAEPSKDSPKISDREADVVAGKRFEDHPEARRVSELAGAAKAAAERERQLQEKIDRKRRIKEEELALELAMEEEAKKDRFVVADRERRRREEALRSADVIKMQLKEADEARQLQEEDLLKEQQAVLSHLERLKLEQEERAKAKVEAARQMNKDVMEWNIAARKEKDLIIQAEKAEDKRVVDYLKEKGRKEKEMEEEKQRRQRAREMEWARMRMQQEKIIDTRAAEDETRARRVFEQKERQWREKERNEAGRRRRLEEELRLANLEAVQAKDEARKNWRKRELQVAEKTREACLEQERQERDAAAASLASKRRFGEELRQQMKDIDRTRGKDGVLRAEEVATYSAARDQATRQFEELKQSKIQELKAAGVPDKYLVDLCRMAAHFA